MKTISKAIAFSIIGGILGTIALPVQADEPMPGFMEDIYGGVIEDEMEEIPEELVLEFVEYYIPDLMPHLMEMRRHDREEFEEHMEEISEHILEYTEMLEYAPDAARLYLQINRLEMNSYILAEKIHDAPQEKREKMLKELQGILVKLFDLRIKMSEMEARQLEEELREVRSMLQKRKQNKGLIIERRLMELTGDDEDLDWF